MFAVSVYLFAFTIPFSIFAGQIAAGLVLVVGLYVMISARGFARVSGWWLILLPSYLGLILISAFVSSYFHDSIPQLRKIWVMLCFIPLAGLSSRYSGKKLIDLLILGTAVASIFALFRYSTGVVGRAAPYSGGYTTIALFIAAVLPFTVYNFVSVKSSKKWAYFGIALLMAVALIFTKTRAGWLAALVGIVITGFAINKRRTLIGLLLGILLLAAIPKTRGIVIERFRSDKKGGITSGRAIIYESLNEPLSNLPFTGYGPGSFNRLVSDDILDRIGDTGVKSWHSTPIEILMESGPLTLLVFIMMAFLPLRELSRQARAAPVDKTRFIALIASITALYMAGLTTNIMRDFMLLSLLIVIWSIPVADRNRSLDCK